jgi:hypothetical protein
MKIAVCFSGQWRTGDYCYDNLKEFLGILYPMCDFFIHTWDINKQKCYNLSNVFSKETKLTAENIDTINKLYKPKKLLVDDYRYTYESLQKYEPSAYVDVKILAVVQPLWYSFMKSVELKKEYEIQNNFKYDYVLKLRPDLKFHPNRRLSQDIEMYNSELDNGEFYIENLIRDWNIDSHTIDDVYFLSNSNSMDTASSYYQKWIDWGILDRSKPFYGFVRHSVLNNLQLSSFKRRDLGGENGYVVLRPECLEYKENTLNNYYECNVCEDYYYGNPKNKAKHKNGYYIDLIKSKYIINEDTDYYIDELEKLEPIKKLV